MYVNVYGDRIRQARILRRRPRFQVADEMNWSAATQTRLERTPIKEFATAVASKLAEALNVSTEFLTTEPEPPLSDDSLLYRTPKSTTKQEKEYLTEFARFVGQVVAVLDKVHKLPPIRLPRLEPGTDIREAARQVRAAFAVEADRPIAYIIHSAERSGVVVVVRTPPPAESEEAWDRTGSTWIERPDKGERHFGCSTWIGHFNERPLTMLRAIDSWERTRWTIAHELGHLALHHTSLPPDAEDTASRFASELLAPAKSLRADIKRHVTLQELAAVKLKWGISLGALIRHLRSSELITLQRYDTLARQLYTRKNPETGRSWGLDEPGWSDREVERPRLLSAWTERCLGSSSPAALAGLNRRWPADLLHGMLSAQRRSDVGATKRAGASPDRVADGQVIRMFGREPGENRRRRASS